MNERPSITLLVVDDSEQGGAVLRANLERFGYRCIEAQNGAQAVRSASALVVARRLLDNGFHSFGAIANVACPGHR